MRYHYAPGSLTEPPPSGGAIVATIAPPFRVLTSARPYDPATPGTPASVVRLAGLGAAVEPRTSVTFALAEDVATGTLIASLAVRIPGTGFAVYTRRVRERSSGWESAACVLRREEGLAVVGVIEFTARLRGEPYVPPPPRPAAFKVPCQGCGAWVSITGAGKIYSSHKCKTTSGTEGRS